MSRPERAGSSEDVDYEPPFDVDVDGPSRSTARRSARRRRRRAVDDSVVVVVADASPARPRDVDKRPVAVIDLSQSYAPTPRIDEVIVVDATPPPPSKRARATPETEGTPAAGGGSGGREECAICARRYSARRVMCSTFCGHVFCEPCLAEVKRIDKKCPACRKPLAGKGYHALFL